jgi:polyhydroxyalkanoate synthase subunit PhaC
MMRQDKKNYAATIDRSLQAAVGKLTGGISPASLMLAFVDWYFHLLIHPSKQIDLFHLYQKGFLHLAHQYLGHTAGNPSGEFCVLTSPDDKRFVGESWQQFPYSFIYESFLLMQQWWHVAATEVRGVNEHNEHVVDFMFRQYLDMISPSNNIFTNPEVRDAALKQKGGNFINGYKNLLDDTHRYLLDEPPAGAEKYVIGENVAVTKGKVIYRNRLIELIQYSPMTDTVYAEPVLITPAWIMKYYILDLTPKHSLVKYLLRKGHTVFMISWKNPKRKDRDLGMDDYLNLGILSALDVINAIVPKQKVHLTGYCLGGTLAAIATAALLGNNDNRLASLTLLAAQVDFTEPGELGLFIDESQIAFLENMMMQKGYLDTHQMAGAFQLLRSNDLIWSRMIHDYLLGNRKSLTDLMAWNADATRLPYKMHSEYLRRLFLHNELSEGKYTANGKPIALSDITIPAFAVATERDHVSPWHSVFKINLYTPRNVTFALTTGGHNVGIVSLPSKKSKRHYRISTIKENDRYIDAETWYKSTKSTGGSWWAAWEKWLAEHSGEKSDPPPMGTPGGDYLPLEDAPGTYVLQK